MSPCPHPNCCIFWFILLAFWVSLLSSTISDPVLPLSPDSPLPLSPMIKLTAVHWSKVRAPYGRVRGRAEGAKRGCNHIRRTPVSTNLDLAKNQGGAGLWPQTGVAEDFRVWPQWEMMHLVFCDCDGICPNKLVLMEGLPFSEEERKKQGKECVRVGLEKKEIRAVNRL